MFQVHLKEFWSKFFVSFQVSRPSKRVVFVLEYISDIWNSGPPTIIIPLGILIRNRIYNRFWYSTAVPGESVSLMDEFSWSTLFNKLGEKANGFVLIWKKKNLHREICCGKAKNESSKSVIQKEKMIEIAK